MARLNVNPTRMELTKLKSLLNTTVKGHKLLKDKQDEMVRQYMNLIKENRELRLEIEKSLSLIMNSFNKATIMCSDSSVEEALLVPSKKLEIDLIDHSIMNIHVPNLLINDSNQDIDLTYGFSFTPSLLDSSVLSLSELMDKLIRLASVEKTCDMLAVEIEKTRRRVNAIEFVMIPNYQETIHFITMKLDDNERSNTIRLMKSKEIILKKQTNS